MLYMCTPGYKTGKTDICKMHYFTQDLLLAELKIIEKSLCLGKASYVSIICYYLSVTYFLLKCHCKMQVDRTFEICNKFFSPQNTALFLLILLIHTSSIFMKKGTNSSKILCGGTGWYLFFVFAIFCLWITNLRCQITHSSLKISAVVDYIVHRWKDIIS